MARRGPAELTMLACVAVGLAAGCAHGPGLSRDPLPSWNDTATRQAIIGFVESVTDPNSKAFVPPDQRIAVFDNDGTLWSEKPTYFQLLFAIDRVKALAPEHPDRSMTRSVASSGSTTLRPPTKFFAFGWSTSSRATG